MVMKRLPFEIQDEILTGFLYWEFLTTFMIFFKIKKPINDKMRKTPSLFSKINYHVYFTWMDKPYQRFMQSILFSLEPIRYEQWHVIHYETDEPGQVTFIQKGTIKIGFEFMKDPTFVIKKENHSVLAAYPVTFNQRCRFIYKVFSKEARGYFIRREIW